MWATDQCHRPERVLVIGPIGREEYPEFVVWLANPIDFGFGFDRLPGFTKVFLSDFVWESVPAGVFT